MDWAIEPLAATHVRDKFTCGYNQLDEYIRSYDSQHARKHVGRTFVAIVPGEQRVLGHYTLSSSSVAFSHAPQSIQRKLPRYPIPVVLLGKPAVDQTVQGQGLGEYLLVDALRRIVEIADQLAIFAVEVHAIDERATASYTKYGFQTLQDDPAHPFLPVATVKQLF